MLKREYSRGSLDLRPGESLERGNIKEGKVVKATIKSVLRQKIKAIRDKLAIVFVHIDDEDMLLYTLKGLSSEYNGFKSAIHTRSEPLSLEELHALLSVEEQAIEANHSLACQDSHFSAMAAINNQDRANTLMAETFVPRTFWAEVMLHFIYLINRMPTKLLGNICPYFVLFDGSLPTYSLFRIFGCVCYVHLSPHERNKLSPKSVRCMYLGFGDSQKGYRCYDPHARRIRISRNVVFLENVSFHAQPSPPLLAPSVAPSGLTWFPDIPPVSSVTPAPLQIPPCQERAVPSPPIPPAAATVADPSIPEIPVDSAMKLKEDRISGGTPGCQVVAMPYPGRGHINAMMNVCKLLASRLPHILITFVVTEEWLHFLGSEPTPLNIQLRSIPNVIPSEVVRGADFPGFVEATVTKMQDPFERLLDQLEVPVTAIVADTLLPWAVTIGNRRNIPVASLWPMSPSVFSVYHHFELLVQNRHFPAELSESGDERVDYIPGISNMRLSDLPTIFFQKGHRILNRVVEAFSWVPKAQCLILTSFYELETHVTDTLRASLPFPVYPIGPAIPYSSLGDTPSINTGHSAMDYFKWLDYQPRRSVLYVSLGSFLLVSSAQMDEIAAGLCGSGVRYLWVARGETSHLQEACGEMGLVVPWCDQLRVLCHSSVGAFWTHCGWNSTLEGVFAGVPFLTFPISVDQVPNSKLIVEEWKVGWRVKREVGGEILVKREEIAGIVKRFMELEGDENKEMRRRARELQETCGRAIEKGGSSEINLDAFIKDVLHCLNQ
ncbi:hypothetical protein HHK36_016120 [Tetracentron sinense]|uniref:Retroviral polymerase SH3-like domain-containing protein n=1 Tax=Tetracentron sinense TaxID=13715 RepID=A0A834YZK8_TETSI|nr:hypothetical protein HHK36_016120 [Tetracentron sinense]